MNHCRSVRRRMPGGGGHYYIKCLWKWHLSNIVLDSGARTNFGNGSLGEAGGTSVEILRPEGGHEDLGGRQARDARGAFLLARHRTRSASLRWSLINTGRNCSSDLVVRSRSRPFVRGAMLSMKCDYSVVLETRPLFPLRGEESINTQNRLKDRQTESKHGSSTRQFEPNQSHDINFNCSLLGRPAEEE